MDASRWALVWVGSPVPSSDGINTPNPKNGPRGCPPTTFWGTIEEDGSLTAFGQNYTKWSEIHLDGQGRPNLYPGKKVLGGFRLPNRQGQPMAFLNGTVQRRNIEPGKTTIDYGNPAPTPSWRISGEAPGVAPVLATLTRTVIASGEQYELLGYTRNGDRLFYMERNLISPGDWELVYFNVVTMSEEWRTNIGSALPVPHWCPEAGVFVLVSTTVQVVSEGGAILSSTPWPVFPPTATFFQPRFASEITNHTILPDGTIVHIDRFTPFGSPIPTLRVSRLDPDTFMWTHTNTVVDLGDLPTCDEYFYNASLAGWDSATNTVIFAVKVSCINKILIGVGPLTYNDIPEEQHIVYSVDATSETITELFRKTWEPSDSGLATYPELDTALLPQPLPPLGQRNEQQATRNQLWAQRFPNGSFAIRRDEPLGDPVAPGFRAIPSIIGILRRRIGEIYNAAGAPEWERNQQVVVQFDQTDPAFGLYDAETSERFQVVPHCNGLNWMGDRYFDRGFPTSPRHFTDRERYADILRASDSPFGVDGVYTNGDGPEKVAEGMDDLAVRYNWHSSINGALLFEEEVFSGTKTAWRNVNGNSGAQIVTAAHAYDTGRGWSLLVFQPLTNTEGATKLVELAGSSIVKTETAARDLLGLGPELVRVVNGRIFCFASRPSVGGGFGTAEVVVLR